MLPPPDIIKTAQRVLQTLTENSYPSKRDILRLRRWANTPTEGVTALAVDQPYLQQPIEGIAKGGEMAPQVSAGSIAEAQRFDEGGIAQSTLFQISNRLGVAVELKLIESCCLPQ